MKEIDEEGKGEEVEEEEETLEEAEVTILEEKDIAGDGAEKDLEMGQSKTVMSSIKRNKKAQND